VPGQPFNRHPLIDLLAREAEAEPLLSVGACFVAKTATKPRLLDPAESGHANETGSQKGIPLRARLQLDEGDARTISGQALEAGRERGRQICDGNNSDAVSPPAWGTAPLLREKVPSRSHIGFRREDGTNAGHFHNTR
jgi:hypothetical protein